MQDNTINTSRCIFRHYVSIKGHPHMCFEEAPYEFSKQKPSFYIVLHLLLKRKFSCKKRKQTTKEHP